MQGTSLISQASATGFTVSGVCATTIKSILLALINSFATSAARLGLDWLSLTMTSTAWVWLPILMPLATAFLNSPSTKPSGSAKIASGPVDGVTNPILMARLCARSTAGAIASNVAAPPVFRICRRLAVSESFALCMTSPSPIWSFLAICWISNHLKWQPVCKARRIATEPVENAAVQRWATAMPMMATGNQLRAPIARTSVALRRAGRLLLDIAQPPLCPSCRAPLGDGAGLCAACWSKLSLIEPPYCARLGIPFAYDPGPGLLSMEAIANPPAYDRARAAVRYDDIARQLVTSFKYTDRLDLAPMMGHWMARAGRELLGQADALLPVPLHWRRLWARRFNQSAALARARRRSRSVCPRPNAPTTCKAPSACRRRKRPRWPAAGWC